MRYLYYIYITFIFTSLGLFVSAQTANVSKSSIQYKPDPSKQELSVGFRLIDDKNVTKVSVDYDADNLKTTWEVYEGLTCSWLIVIDVSNPRRAATIKKCIDHSAILIKKFKPETDKFSVYSLARDLVEVVPFDSALGQIQEGFKKVKPEGDAALTTLIFSNLLEAVSHLEKRDDQRKAIVLMTDGIDESPSPEEKEISKNKLIEAAKKSGIVIHTIGYAETGDGQKFFGSLKEISSSTEGLHLTADLKNKQVESKELELIQEVMLGAGTANIDISKIAASKKSENLDLKITTASGNVATIEVPAEEVAKAFPPEKKPENNDPDPENEVKDTDGDGLSDKVETKTGIYVDKNDTGTDPNKGDTDGDGLSDKVETKTGIYVDKNDTGTDPNKEDTDGDGLSDKVETNTGIYVDKNDTGTDPNDEDTDNDELIDGVENNSGLFEDDKNTGSNPLVSDTDLDSVNDGEEVKAGTDPNKKDTFFILIIGVGAVLLILILLLLRRSALKKKATAEAEAAELARIEEEERIAQEALKAEQMNAENSQPLAWLEMCDADQSREPITSHNLRIGRGKHNDIVLRNNSVSGNHCIIERNRDGEWKVTDLKSGNGVLINGKEIQQAPINNGDMIEIGEIKMRFILA